MESIRFNPFHKIHQALRALLYHVSLTVQHTDASNEEQYKKTLAQAEQLVAFFEGHAHTEDTLVFPMIAAAAPEVVADFEAQHQEDHRLGEALVNAISSCRKAVDATERYFAIRALQRALHAFTAFNLTHMNQEETVVLDIIHANYTDADLYQKEAEIVASLSPEKLAFSSYWMLKGLSADEIIEWFRAIKEKSPAFVLAAQMQIAEQALPDEKLKALQKGLAYSFA